MEPLDGSAVSMIRRYIVKPVSVCFVGPLSEEMILVTSDWETPKSKTVHRDCPLLCFNATTFLPNQRRFVFIFVWEKIITKYSAQAFSVSHKTGRDVTCLQ